MMLFTIVQYLLEFALILVSLWLTIIFFKNVGPLIRFGIETAIQIANYFFDLTFRLIYGRRGHKRQRKDEDLNNNSFDSLSENKIEEEQKLNEISTWEWITSTVYRGINAIWECVVLLTLSAYYITETLILSITPSYLRTKKSLRDQIVVITGGAGGVGQELTIRLAKIKAKVVIWDVNEEAIRKAQERFKNENIQVYSYVVDVTDQKMVAKIAEIVKTEIGPVDILINNAGIVSGNTFMELPEDMVEQTFKVNVISHFWTTKAFLKTMIQRGKGHIVTVGSMTGLLGTYKCCDYSATKFAAVGLHESLLTELKTHGHDNINMTLICPYFINTGMFDGCKPKNMAMLEPKDVAKRIVTAIRLNEVFVTVPSIARFAVPVKYYIPAKLAWAMMYRLIQGPQTMMGMRSHQKQINKITEIPQEITTVKEDSGAGDYLQF